MNFKNILIETKDGIGWLTINRPGQMNALTMETVSEIEIAVRQIAEETAVKVIAITGAGEKAFVAGADIAAMREMTPTQAEEFAEQGHRTMQSIEECARPVIAAVNGYALGGGTEIALACDIVIAAETAKFGLPEVKLGIYPGFGGTQRLPRLIGAMRARELIFTGRVISAAEAYAIGLVNHVVPPGALKDEVTKLAQEIMANGPIAVAATKRLINEGMSCTLSEALENERKEFPRMFKTHDMKEGLTAFLEKRKPNFTGT